MVPSVMLGAPLGPAERRKQGWVVFKGSRDWEGRVEQSCDRVPLMLRPVRLVDKAGQEVHGGTLGEGCARAGWTGNRDVRQNSGFQRESTEHARPWDPVDPVPHARAPSLEQPGSRPATHRLSTCVPLWVASETRKEPVLLLPGVTCCTPHTRRGRPAHWVPPRSEKPRSGPGVRSWLPDTGYGAVFKRECPPQPEAQEDRVVTTGSAREACRKKRIGPDARAVVSSEWLPALQEMKCVSHQLVYTG